MLYLVCKAFKIWKNTGKKINKKTNSTIMKLKDFIYNKKTKESNLLGVLFVVVVTIVSGAVLYYGFWI